MSFVRSLIAAVGLSLAVTGAASAQQKPAELKIGITTFLSGPASVFGVPAKAAAELLAEELNKKGGIGGVPVKLSFIDEGAGGEALVSNYRRLVTDEKVDVTFASISSGSCTQLVPLAEDLKIMNFMWDCGAYSILENKKHRYNFRTQANGAAEMMAVITYLLKVKPDFKTVAFVAQDYAWGRESHDIISNALKVLKPDAKWVAEFFPKFGAPDYSTEVSRLLALRPDVVITTSWGGDLDTFVRQSGQRGLLKQSTFVLAIGESSIQRLGKDLPEGVIVGARGDHYFLHPEFKNEPSFKAYVQAFKDKTGAFPIYPAFHMSQAFTALKAAYDKAIKANNGNWPSREQVVDAMSGLEFKDFGRPIKIREEDGQGLEAQIVGTTKQVPEYDFKVLDNIMVFDAEKVATPAGQKTIDWVKTLKPDFVKMEAKTYKHGQ
ncbi:leucine-, isoleucine-, valine-, threonine-, and alanine-binding protein precursor [Variibacter gotjawalensis]|uniref:Leucine-, isoleucine-, valine-, threonine-, and alanine-binding protein n=1 Tax=Variibacter gotjawalensis TaxID=1333996 RepID=A0A0S3PZ94_9BRAD|nr:ABC transporter substrate-binding protein [Variibacter gotjawalensis]NIK47087.1 branched-chain amino acid transport system substrate-binding protein [Variibacter gotjawalensis]RZS48989.1 amino acid/amide ABC transporter substrate-binding protein (HAAT family) [Variibacter gotjawalensis]BAT61249.1 leucine-, isoleucine-, valine-, threonine-, and alanine-binding protein precursor [Variibacter gotjawalensis]